MNTLLNRTSVKRILIIKPRAIGDVILATIVTRNLRLAFPDAEIDFLTEPPAREVVENNPYLNRVLLYDVKTHGPLYYIREVRGRRYDLVIDLFGNPRTALLTRMSGAALRVGYDFRGRRYAYSLRVQPRGDRVHNTQFNLDALEAIGVPIVDRSLHVTIDDTDREYVSAFLAESSLQASPLVALGTGGGWYTKRWALERFAELGDRLVARVGVTVIPVWGPGQREEAEKIRSLMKETAFVPPPTTLRQLGALFERCAFLVSNDSGPMHLAAAVGTPVLGIYGPTNPLLQGPYGDHHLVVRKDGLPCLGCNYTGCPIGHPCMRDLTVDAVFQAAEHLVRKNGIALGG